MQRAFVGDAQQGRALLVGQGATQGQLHVQAVVPLALLAVVAGHLDVYASQGDVVLLGVIGHGQGLAAAQRGIEIIMGLRVRAGAAQVGRQIGEQRRLAWHFDALAGAVGGITGETDGHDRPPGR
ncbi:hypothetical protein D9M71_662710 [compost metagenome]